MEVTHDELEATWPRVAVLWWSFTWRCAMWGAFVGAFLSFWFGNTVLAQLLALLSTLPISFWVMRVVVRRRFTNFRIKLIPNTAFRGNGGG